MGRGVCESIVPYLNSRCTHEPILAFCHQLGKDFKILKQREPNYIAIQRFQRADREKANFEVLPRIHQPTLPLSFPPHSRASVLRSQKKMDTAPMISAICLLAKCVSCCDSADQNLSKINYQSDEFTVSHWRVSLPFFFTWVWFISSTHSLCHIPHYSAIMKCCGNRL